MRENLASIRKFLKKHQTAIAVVGTATAGLYLNAKALKQHDDFLKEHDLYYEYYPHLKKD